MIVTAFLRSCLFALVQLVTTPIFAVIALLTFPFAPLTRYRVITTWTRIIVKAAEVICGVRYRVLADGELNHTGALVLLDTNGRVITRSTKTSGVVDPIFLARVRSVLAPSAAPRP